MELTWRRLRSNLTSGFLVRRLYLLRLSKLTWFVGPKSPGLVILEHEDSADAFTAFTSAFPKILEKGWKFESLAHLFGQGQAYQNSLDSNSEVKPYGILSGGNGSLTMTSQSSAVASSVPLSSE